MIRREALDILEHNWTRLVNPDYSDKELCEALDVAIKALEQEPCEDAVSRQAVIDTIGKVLDYGDGMVWEALSHAQRDVVLLPSVNPQEPKIGHWKMKHYIDKNRQGFNMWMCSECYNEYSYDAETGVGITDAHYCPNCGAKMVEPQESEEEE